jgi:hypothetical protein
MLDLQPEEPTIYWTFRKFPEYAEYGFEEDEDEVWITETIGKPIVRADSIKFDVPESWECDDNSTIEFRPAPDGYWTARFYGLWEAFPGESTTHRMLTGTWRDGADRGAFIAIFPKSGPN